MLVDPAMVFPKKLQGKAPSILQWQTEYRLTRSPNLNLYRGRRELLVLGVQAWSKRGVAIRQSRGKIEAEIESSKVALSLIESLADVILGILLLINQAV